jgi:hypothetical protein
MHSSFYTMSFIAYFRKYLGSTRCERKVVVHCCDLLLWLYQIPGSVADTHLGVNHNQT